MCTSQGHVNPVECTRAERLEDDLDDSPFLGPLVPTTACTFGFSHEKSIASAVAYQNTNAHVYIHVESMRIRELVWLGVQPTRIR